MVMALGMLGYKIGMTQVYDDAGKIAPVTVLQLGPCPVLQVRSKDRDGYDAVQVGFQDKARRKATRPERGHVADELQSKRRKSRQGAGVAILPKANCEPQRFIREFRLAAPAELEVGKLLRVAEIFAETKQVDVIGTTKGRGYQGVVKRHNYGGLRATHGVKKGERQRGSMGSNASNRGSGRPKKGIRMAGHYGADRRTARNLDVVRIDADNNLMLVRGAVPGFNGSLVMVQPTTKR
jgi:large subunit ribosomal protein L3